MSLDLVENLEVTENKVVATVKSSNPAMHARKRMQEAVEFAIERKFGADVLQHPRGVAVDHWGRIVVVECKVMRVVIFDMVGNVLGKFSCSR